MAALVGTRPHSTLDRRTHFVEQALCTRGFLLVLTAGAVAACVRVQARATGDRVRGLALIYRRRAEWRAPRAALTTTTRDRALCSRASWGPSAVAW